MYLRSGTLGPHYVLEKFKATDALDTNNLEMLKLSGVLKHKVRKMDGKICCYMSTGERITSCS